MQMKGVEIEGTSVRLHNTHRNPGDDRQFHQRSCHPGRCRSSSTTTLGWD